MKPRLVFPIRGRQDQMRYGKLLSETTNHSGGGRVGGRRGKQGWIKILFAVAC